MAEPSTTPWIGDPDAVAHTWYDTLARPLAEAFGVHPVPMGHAWLSRSPALFFLFFVTLILVVPPICRRLRVPDIVGLILVGMAVGPYALNLIPDVPASLTGMLGYAGLLFLLFLSGMETDIHQFLRSRRRSLAFGTLTYLIPQVGGLLLGRGLLGLDWTASFLFGSMLGSHTLLTYPQASRLGLGRHEPVTVSVGATMVANLIALLVLAGVVQANTGEARGVWGLVADVFPPAKNLVFQLGVGTPILAATIFYGVPKIARRFLAVVPENGPGPFLFVMGSVFFSAWAAEIAGLESILGAFAIGLALNRLIPEQSVLMNRVSFMSETLFVPAFLMTVGMKVDVAGLFRGGAGMDTLVASVSMGLGILLLKWLPAKLTARAFGYSPDDTGLMFGLTVVQAAATLAAVLVGVRLGLFSAAVLNGSIAMILVSCMVGAWATERYGRRVAARVAASVVPTAQRLDQRIVIPLANPSTVARLLDFAFLIRDRKRRGALMPLMVARDDGHIDRAVANSERLLGLAVSHATAADQTVTPLVRVDVNVADGILRAVAEARATDVLLGWSGAPRSRAFFFGELADQLIETCPSRLHVVRLVRPPSLTGRVVWAIPPYTEFVDDFAECVWDAKHFALHAGVSEMVAIVPEESAAALEKKLPDMTPTLTMRFRRARTLAEYWRTLAEELRTDDTIVVTLARSGPGAFSTLKNAAPHHLAATHPDHNLMLTYTALPMAVADDDVDIALREDVAMSATPSSPMSSPPLSKADAAASVVAQPSGEASSSDAPPPMRNGANGGKRKRPAGTGTTGLRPLLTELDELVNMPAAEMDFMLYKAVSAVWPGDRRAAAKALAAMRDVARSYPAQIRPGVLLIHARAPRITQPALVVATSATPLSLPTLSTEKKLRGWHIDASVHVVICLFRPESTRDERDRHLAVLSSLGRAFRPPDVVERLLSAKTSAHIGRILDGVDEEEDTEDE